MIPIGSLNVNKDTQDKIYTHPLTKIRIKKTTEHIIKLNDMTNFVTLNECQQNLNNRPIYTVCVIVNKSIPKEMNRNSAINSNSEYKVIIELWDMRNHTLSLVLNGVFYDMYYDKLEFRQVLLIENFSNFIASNSHKVYLTLSKKLSSNIFILGYASDLSTCTGFNKSGEPCKNYVNISHSLLCEFHLKASISKSKQLIKESIGTVNSRSIDNKESKGRYGFNLPSTNIRGVPYTSSVLTVGMHGIPATKCQSGHISMSTDHNKLTKKPLLTSIMDTKKIFMQHQTNPFICKVFDQIVNDEKEQFKNKYENQIYQDNLIETKKILTMTKNRDKTDRLSHSDKPLFTMLESSKKTMEVNKLVAKSALENKDSLLFNEHKINSVNIATTNTGTCNQLSGGVSLNSQPSKFSKAFASKSLSIHMEYLKNNKGVSCAENSRSEAMEIANIVKDKTPQYYLLLQDEIKSKRNGVVDLIIKGEKEWLKLANISEIEAMACYCFSCHTLSLNATNHCIKQGHHMEFNINVIKKYIECTYCKFKSYYLVPKNETQDNKIMHSFSMKSTCKCGKSEWIKSNAAPNVKQFQNYNPHNESSLLDNQLDNLELVIED